MIVFRKDRAETIFPPTSSVDLALKRLGEIPTGGKTPLGAGLLEAYKLIRRLKLKQPKTRFLILLLTDGKANVSLRGKNTLDEIRDICFLLKDFPSTDFIIIDTEKKDNFIKMDLAFSLAKWLQAGYFLIEELKSETLFQIANSFVYKLQ